MLAKRRRWAQNWCVRARLRSIFRLPPLPRALAMAPPPPPRDPPQPSPANGALPDPKTSTVAPSLPRAAIRRLVDSAWPSIQRSGDHGVLAHIRGLQPGPEPVRSGRTRAAPLHCLLHTGRQRRGRCGRCGGRCGRRSRAVHCHRGVGGPCMAGRGGREGRGEGHGTSILCCPSSLTSALLASTPPGPPPRRPRRAAPPLSPA